MFKRLFFLFQIFIVSSFAYDLTKSETTENVMVAANSIVAQGTAKGELNPASNDVLFGLKLLEKAEALPDNQGWKVATDATCESCRIGTQGFFGSAIEFDNEPDKLLIDSSAVNAFNGPAFSFSGWFRLGFGKGSVMKRNEFSLVEHGANKGWADSNLKSSVYEKSGFLEMKVYVRKKSDPEQWVLVIGKGISLSTVSSGQWIHCAFVANVDKLTIFMNGQSLKSVENQPMLTNIGSARGKTNEKYSVAKNLYGAVDDAAIWSKALSEADVLAQAESINHYGKFVSLPMSVGNVLEGIKLTYSEIPKDSVNAAISVDGGNVWINVENGVSLNPFWWQSMLSDKPEAQFRFLFSKSAAKVTDVEFELTANDETVPTVSNVKATPSAHGATITFDTDEIAFSQIEFEFDGTMLTRSPQESDARLTHEIQIDGALPNNKEIKFNIIVEDANKNKGSAHSGTFKTKDLCLTNGLELCGNKIDDDCNGLTDEEEACYNQHDVLRSTLAEYPRHDNVEFNCNAWAAKPSTPERTLENFTRESDEFGEHNGTNTASCSGSSFTITGSVDKPSRVTVDLKIPPGPAFLLSLDTFQDFSGSRTYRVFYAFDTDDFQKEHVRPLEKRYYMNFYLITPPSGAKLVRLIVEGTGHVVYLNGAGTLALRREARRSRDLNADTPLNILFDWNAGDFRADDERTADPSNPLDVSMAQIKARALRAGKPLEGFNSRLLSGWGSASSAFTPPLRLGTTGPRDIVDSLHKQAFACLWLSTNVTVEGEDGNRGVNAETMCKAAVKSVMTIADWTDADPRNGDAGFGRNEGGGSSASAGGVTTVLGNGEMLSGYAIAVDWMWPFLSAAQRRHAMSTLERETLYMLHRSTLNGKWTFETWWHWDPASNNWGAIAGSGMLLGGIVLQGFSPYADDMMKIGCWLDRISMSKLSPFVGFPDQLLEKPSDLPPTHNRADGVPYESHGYTSYPLTFAVPALIAYMRAGPNESETCLNPVSFQGGKMTNVATYFAYTTHAQRVGFTTFDDYYGAAHTGTMISTSWTLGLAGMLAAVGLEDKAAAHLEHWNRLYGSDKNTDWVWVSGGNPLQLVGTIMFYPGSAVKKKSFEELNFPLVRRFQYGRIVSRTGWSLNNDSVLTTQAGEFGAHTHYDQGSFFFTDFGLPLISEGRKSKETKVHSIVEIDDKNQDTSDGWTAYATSKLTTSARADVILMDYRQSWNLPLQQAYRVFVHLRKATPTCPSPLIVIDRLKLNDTSTHKFVSRIYADEQHSIESSSNGFVFKGENKPIREDILVKRNSDVDLDVLVSGAAKNGDALEIVANDKSEATFEFGFIARLQSTPNPASCDTLKKIASSDSTVSLYSFNDDVTAIVNLDAHFDDTLATAHKLTDAVNSDAFVVVHNKKVNDIGTLIVMATRYTSSSGPVKAVTLDRRSSVAVDIKPSKMIAVQIRVGSDEDFVWKEGELKASISFDSSMVSLGDKVTVRIDGQRDVVTPVTDDSTIELTSPDGDVHVFDVFTSAPPPITTTAAVTTRTAVAEKTTAPVYDTLTAIGGTTVDGVETTPTVVAASLAVRDAVLSSLMVLICVVAPAMF